MKSSSVVYLTLEEVLVIHDDQIERYGGSFGIRSFELLESALARPQASFGGKDLYPTIIDKAAALFHSLIFNHSFIDGNKRTAIVSTARFLHLNGYKFSTSEKEIVRFPLKVENKHLDIKQIATWLKKNSKPLSSRPRI